jgi:anti-sigma-K factor RskA
MNPELHALAGPYALDAVADHERQAFEEHLMGCEDCANEVRSLQDAAAELTNLSAVTPPPQLRADVLAAIGRVRPLPPVVDNVVALHRARLSRSVWQLTAAACAIIAIAVGAWGVQQHRDATRQVSAQATAVDQLLSSADAGAISGPVGSNGQATLVYSKSQGKLILVAHNLPKLASNKTYQLWMLSGTTGAASAGLFTADANGNAEVSASGDLSGVARMGISIEPAGGSKTPTPGQIQATMPI